jgi:hypothetical protein
LVESDYWNVMLLSHQEDSMGRRGYPGEFRQRVLDLVAAVRSVGDTPAPARFIRHAWLTEVIR